MKNTQAKQTRIISMVVAVMMLLASLAMLSGCGKAKTLEDYVNAEKDAKSQLEQLEKSISNSTMDVNLEIKENTMTMTLKMKEKLSKDMVATYKKTFEDSFAKSDSNPISSMVQQLQKESGIKDASMKVLVLNGDDSEIFSHEYK